MIEILIVFLLILLNGFFALSEMAVVTARKARLRQMAAASRGAARALELAEHPERFLSTVQVGITLVNIVAGVFGGAAIGVKLAKVLRDSGVQDPEIALGLAMTASVAGITFATIVIGELVPKRLALRAPERISAAIAMPMMWLARLASPFVYLLSATTRLLLRLFRLRRDRGSSVTEEEIRLLVAEGHEQGVFDSDERNMVNRVLRLGDRTAENLMTPRTRIVWLDTEASDEENLAVMRETPYSRYPVYRGSDQEVLGILEVKTLAGRINRPNTELFRKLKPALFVSESTRATSLMEILRDEQQTLALVVDEYGDIQGLVTINDVLGAVMGRVQTAPEHGRDALVVTREDGSHLIGGSLSTEDLRELLNLTALPDEEDGDYNTVAGMVIASFGRIPHVGEHFDWGGWRFEVVDLDGARIDKLLVQPGPERDAEAV
ncbi:MAG TPA: hemolysin family protein [Xanthomonadaceae bacterium]|nr:hemolysin family protein [Xanthomonadaceae bacterium]